MTHRPTLTALALASTLLAGPALAATLSPTAITTSVPENTNNVGTIDPVDGSFTPSGAYTDDVFLETLTFDRPGPGGGSVVFDAANGSFRAARTFEVTGSRTKINAEWGDDDDNADGDDNPFEKAGFPIGGGVTQETTDPTIQDLTLLNVFNDRSLTETTDGESRNGTMQFVTTFTNSLAYDDVGGDTLPDITFIERGGNDAFSVELIVGGTAKSPVYSSALAMNSGNFWRSGININTVEIGSAQELWVGGFDFRDWGLGTGDVVSGFRLTTDGGPDLAGFFLTAENSSDFGVPVPVPLPAGLMLLLGGLFGLGTLRAKRRA